MQSFVWQFAAALEQGLLQHPAITRVVVDRHVFSDELVIQVWGHLGRKGGVSVSGQTIAAARHDSAKSLVRTLIDQAVASVAGKDFLVYQSLGDDIIEMKALTQSAEPPPVLYTQTAEHRFSKFERVEVQQDGPDRYFIYKESP